MLLSALASWLHVLGIGLMFVTAAFRGHAISKLPTEGEIDRPRVDRVLFWDNLAGLAALLAMGSGLWRLFGGLEKGTEFYTGSALFWTKMGLLALAWGFEMYPMITFIRWRARLARGEPILATPIRRIRLMERPELATTLAVMFAATLMARGYGQREAPGVTADEGALREGEAVYRANCSTCHQADGRGQRGKLAADFVGDPRRLAKLDDELLAKIADGVPNTAMIGFRSRLSEREMREALRYIRATFTPRPVE